MKQHSVIEASLRRFTRALSRAMVSEQTARRRGLLQALDPRTRLIGILALVVVAAMSRRIAVVATMLAIAAVIALLSRVPLKTLVLRVWLIIFVFTGLIAFPALFITPGTVVGRVAGMSVTAQGVRSAALLVLRVEAAATFTTALVLCTQWTHILKALRSLRVPAEVIAMLAMTHRYIFLLIEVAQQMFESRQSRIVRPLTGREHRGMAARTAGVMMSKSIEMGNEVFLAMQSRGFSGDVHLLDEFRFKARDAVALATVCVGVIAGVWMGR